MSVKHRRQQRRGNGNGGRYCPQVRSSVFVFRLLLVMAFALFSVGCLYEDEPWQRPADDWDSVAANDPSLCGGAKCSTNEHCGLVDFQQACFCGDHPACGSGKNCTEGESGRLSCEILKPGQEGCGYNGLECESGDTCINTSLVGPTKCFRLCKSAEMFCSDGAYCIGLTGTEYLGGMTGICNLGGNNYYGQSCDSDFDCMPQGMCVNIVDVGAECMQPCRVGKSDCPSYQDCEPLIGASWEGVCF